MLSITIPAMSLRHSNITCLFVPCSLKTWKTEQKKVKQQIQKNVREQQLLPQ